MLTFNKFRQIIGAISFPNTDLIIGKMGNGFYLQVAMFLMDTDITGEAPLGQGPQPLEQTGRKWYISKHAIESEVVTTALKAILTFLEHEAREQFKYKGKALFHPHIDLDALSEAADAKVFRK